MERGSAGEAVRKVVIALILAAWVLAIVALMVLGSLGYLWEGDMPAGFVPWLGGVFMLGGLAVYGLVRPQR
jgi:hypothetical protein